MNSKQSKHTNRRFKWAHDIIKKCMDDSFDFSFSDGIFPPGHVQEKKKEKKTPQQQQQNKTKQNQTYLR